MSAKIDCVLRERPHGTGDERGGTWRCAAWITGLAMVSAAFSPWLTACGGSADANAANGMGTQMGEAAPAATTSTPATSSGPAGAAGSQASASQPASSAASGGQGVGVTPGSGTSSAASAASAASAGTGTATMAMSSASAGASGADASAGMQPAAAGGGAAGAGPTEAMMSVDTSEPMPSAGCMGGSLRAGRTMGSIQSSGGNRTYIQYVPSSYDGSKPVPMVVDLHPYSVGASFAESSSGFRQLADTEGYVYLAPQGMSNMWDATGDTDEKFIRDLVNEVGMEGCIDLRRVYATGCSNGGAFSFLLMCTADDVFAAVAPMCGTAFFDIENECMMDRPVSLMLRIGRQDTLNCWEGEGMVLDAPNVEPGTRIQCAKTIQKIFTEKYHCKGEIQMMDECELVGDCDEGSEVAICYENTGHVVYQANTARDTYAFLKQFYKH